jgi:hypothetical protein
VGRLLEPFHQAQLFQRAGQLLLGDIRNLAADARAIDDGQEEFETLFRRFVTASVGRQCLKLDAVSKTAGQLGPNWSHLDLISVDTRAKASGMVRLDLEDECFDLVMCADLDRVSHPFSLVQELWRILKPGGQIWCQVPLSERERGTEEADGATQYWRITPEGLRLLGKRFDEILCSVFQPRDRGLQAVSFFYGLKPVDDPDR